MAALGLQCPPGASGLGARMRSLEVALCGSWVLGSRWWACKCELWGFQELCTPGRHPCGPQGSLRTNSLAALCVRCAARRYPCGRGGHRCAGPAAAPLLPAEVATLGVALGEEGGLLRAGRGQGQKWGLRGEDRPESDLPPGSPGPIGRFRSQIGQRDTEIPQISRPSPGVPVPALCLTSWAEAAPASDPTGRAAWRAGAGLREADGLDSGAQGHRAAQLQQRQVAAGLVLGVVGGQQHPPHARRERAGPGGPQAQRA